MVWPMMAVNKLLSIILWRGEARDPQLPYEIPELWPKLLMKFQARGIWAGGSKVVSLEVCLLWEIVLGNYGRLYWRSLRWGKSRVSLYSNVMIWGFTCDSHNTKHFICITSFNPYSHLTRQYYYLHFTEEQTGVQRGKCSCLRSHGWSYSKPCALVPKKGEFQ